MTRSFPSRATGSPHEEPESPGSPPCWGSPLSLPPFALLLPRSPRLLCDATPVTQVPQSGTEKPRIDTGVRGFFLWNGPLGFRVNLRTQDALRRWQNSARYSHAGHLSDVTSCEDGGKIRALILNTETVNRIPLRRKYAHGQD